MTLGSLRLHTAYQLNATRVNRAGVDLLASPGLRLQMGDRITVVGTLADIDRLAHRLGNSLKRLNEPNLITIFVGILVGILVGLIDLGWGMKLRSGWRSAGSGHIAEPFRLQVQTRDLYIKFGINAYARTWHLSVPCIRRA